MLNAVKFILVGVAVIAVLLVAVGLYVMDQYEKLEANSALMKQIHILEEQDQYKQLTALLLEGLRGSDHVERRLAIHWLKKHTEDGRMPSLHLLSLYYAIDGDPDKAARWYATATLVGWTDASRCTDPATRRSVAMLDRLVRPARHHIAAHPEIRTKVARQALEFEQSIKDRHPTEWLLGRAGSSRGRFLSDPDWHRTRDKLRGQFRKAYGIEEPQKTQTVAKAT